MSQNCNYLGTYYQNKETEISGPFLGKHRWINTIIESGSYHFLISSSEINIVAAQIELEESTGEFNEASKHLKSALGELKQTLVSYSSLLESTRSLPLHEQVKNILDKFDYDTFHNRIVKEGLISDENDIWQEFVKTAKKLNPIEVIQLWANKVASIEAPLIEFQKEIDAKTFNPDKLHVILTKYSIAATLGRIITHFNKEFNARIIQSLKEQEHMILNVSYIRG